MSKELVYVCSPLGAPTKEGVQENMQKAKEYMKLVSEKMHCRAIAPHAILPEYLDDSIPEERAVGLRFGLDLLRICKKMVVCRQRSFKWDAERNKTGGAAGDRGSVSGEAAPAEANNHRHRD